MKGIKLENQLATVTIDELESNQIPENIWKAKSFQNFKIQKTRSSKWVTHPPLSWFETRIIEPPYWNVPEEIGNLSHLKSLYLVDLNIRELPPAITNLENLEVLDLSLNKLDISKELSKFRKLKSLKHLILLGNHFDTAEMIAFQQEFPNMKVVFRDEGD